MTYNMACKSALLFLVLFLWSSEATTVELVDMVELYSTYDFMNLFKMKKMNPEKYCFGFICQLCRLNDSQIGSLVEKENEIRNLYLNHSSVDGGASYQEVKWNENLAEFAQCKAQLCLPPTGNKTIYEHKSLKDWTEFNPPLNENVVIAVAIGTRIKKLRNTSTIDLPDTLTQHLEDFNSTKYVSQPFKQRGKTVHMGCGYMMAANRSYQVDHMVCAYGFLVFEYDAAVQNDSYDLNIDDNLQPLSNISSFSESVSSRRELRSICELLECSDTDLDMQLAASGELMPGPMWSDQYVYSPNGSSPLSDDGASCRRSFFQSLSLLTFVAVFLTRGRGLAILL